MLECAKLSDDPHGGPGETIWTAKERHEPAGMANEWPEMSITGWTRQVGWLQVWLSLGAGLLPRSAHCTLQARSTKAQ